MQSAFPGKHTIDYFMHEENEDFVRFCIQAHSMQAFLALQERWQNAKPGEIIWMDEGKKANTAPR